MLFPGLEYPKLDEWKEMEEKYFVPLRSGGSDQAPGHSGAVLEADGHGLKSCQGRAELSTICPNHIKAPSCFQVI